MIAASGRRRYREMYAGFITGGITWEGRGERARGSIGVEDGLHAMIR